jgi:hypothetical protein
MTTPLKHPSCAKKKKCRSFSNQILLKFSLVGTTGSQSVVDKQYYNLLETALMNVPAIFSTPLLSEVQFLGHPQG